MDFNINSTVWVHIHYYQKALTNYYRVAIYLELISKLSSKILLYLQVYCLTKSETHNGLYKALIIVIIFFILSQLKYIFIEQYVHIYRSNS